MRHALLFGLRIRDLAQIEWVLGWQWHELRGSVDWVGIDGALCMEWQAKAMGIEQPRCGWNGSGWDGGG